jgi:pimeloyl-ACP methyl ester carboxylesterase
MRILKTVMVLIILFVLGVVGLVYLAPEKATKLVLDIERSRSGLTRKEINLPGGLHYAYLEGGEGEVLMLLHGFGANKDNFTRVARFLTPHYRVIVPDHIGFGESSHPQDADYSAKAQAARIRSLAHSLGIANMHLGGNSMGGHISMMYAALYPGEIKSLWLLDPGGIWSAPKSEVHTILARTGENPLMAKNEAEFAGIFHFVMAKPPFIPRPMLNVMAQERIRNYNLEERIFKVISSDSAERYVDGLKAPALIVWGEKDRVINPVTAGILYNMMPNSEVIIMPGLGHLPMIEQPAKTAQDYLKFRARFEH